MFSKILNTCQIMPLLLFTLFRLVVSITILSFYCFPMMPGCAMIIFCSISNKDKKTKKIQGLSP